MSKLVVFSTKPYDKAFFSQYCQEKYGQGKDEESNGNNSSSNKEFTIQYLQNKLDKESAHLAAGYDAVCIFVNDDASKEVLQELANGGTKLMLLRCAGRVVRVESFKLLL